MRRTPLRKSSGPRGIDLRLRNTVVYSNDILSLRENPFDNEAHTDAGRGKAAGDFGFFHGLTTTSAVNKSLRGRLAKRKIEFGTIPAYR